MRNLIKKILKEGDLDWVHDVEPPFPKVRTGSDYVDVWPRLSYIFLDNCVEVDDGYVISDDYNMEVDISLGVIDKEFNEIIIWVEDRNKGDEEYYNFWWECTLYDRNGNVFEYQSGNHETPSLDAMFDPISGFIQKHMNNC